MALGIWSVLKKNGHIRTIDFTKIWGNVNTKSGDAYKQLKNSSIILFSHQILRLNSFMVKLSFSRLWKYNSQLRTKKNEIPSEPFQILRSTTTQHTRVEPVGRVAKMNWLNHDMGMKIQQFVIQKMQSWNILAWICGNLPKFELFFLYGEF